MELLNQEIDLSERDARKARKEWSHSFLLYTEEDSVEFCQFMLEINSWIKTDNISVTNAFKNAYHQRNFYDAIYHKILQKSNHKKCNCILIKIK